LKYYKVIKDSEFIGVATDLDMRRFQKKHKIILCCGSDVVQYIQIDNVLYHDNWMLKASDEVESFAATVIEIDADQYDILTLAIEKNEEINIEDNEPTGNELSNNDNEATDTEDSDKETKITVDFVKEQKINEMEHVCTSTITNGFDITLSDGKQYHFSLTTQDQINLLTITSLINSGEENIIYHADGESCRYYEKDDILLILKTASDFKTYHTTYLNSLKSYIKSLRSINKISNITYGIEIPEKYQSDVLKELNNA
jgi:hypothetical protein